MIVPSLARMIVREHLYRPITGKLLCLGRQTIAMTPDQILELFEQEGLKLSDAALREVRAGHDSYSRVGKGTGFITDIAFFGLLGITDLHQMDVSAYEGADIVHDLNRPIPDALVGAFDFIIDGGTFDHLLDLRVAFENVVRLLKPGGRVFQWNAASNYTGCAYVSFGPDLFYDYYVLNRFADCKVYVALVDAIAQKESWDLFEFVPSQSRYYDYHFPSSRLQMTLVMAEKGPLSRYDQLPIQAFYRDEGIWGEYREAQATIAKSKRPGLGSGKLGLKLSRETLGTKVGRAMKKKGLGYVIGRVMSRLFTRTPPPRIPNGYHHIGEI